MSNRTRVLNPIGPDGYDRDDDHPDVFANATTWGHVISVEARAHHGAMALVVGIHPPHDGECSEWVEPDGWPVEIEPDDLRALCAALIEALPRQPGPLS